MPDVVCYKMACHTLAINGCPALLPVRLRNTSATFSRVSSDSACCIKIAPNMQSLIRHSVLKHMLTKTEAVRALFLIHDALLYVVYTAVAHPAVHSVQ
jgi:hypothetical protein